MLKTYILLHLWRKQIRKNSPVLFLLSKTLHNQSLSLSPNTLDLWSDVIKQISTTLSRKVYWHLISLKDSTERVYILLHENWSVKNFNIFYKFNIFISYLIIINN